MANNKEAGAPANQAESKLQPVPPELIKQGFLRKAAGKLVDAARYVGGFFNDKMFQENLRNSIKTAAEQEGKQPEDAAAELGKTTVNEMSKKTKAISQEVGAALGVDETVAAKLAPDAQEKLAALEKEEQIAAAETIGALDEIDKALIRGGAIEVVDAINKNPKGENIDWTKKMAEAATAREKALENLRKSVQKSTQPEIARQNYPQNEDGDQLPYGPQVGKYGGNFMENTVTDETESAPPPANKTAADTTAEQAPNVINIKSPEKPQTTVEQQLATIKDNIKDVAEKNYLIDSDELAEAVRIKIDQKNRDEEGDYFSNVYVIKEKADEVIAEQKNQLQQEQQKILAGWGERRDEEQQKYAWNQVYEDLKNKNPKLAAKVDTIRQKWAVENNAGDDYTDEQTRKLQTGQALLMIVKGEVSPPLAKVIDINQAKSKSEPTEQAKAA